MQLVYLAYFNVVEMNLVWLNSKQFLFHCLSFCWFLSLVGRLCTTIQNVKLVFPVKCVHLGQKECELRMDPGRPSEMWKGKRCRRQTSLAWLWLDLSLGPEAVSTKRMCWLVKINNKDQTDSPHLTNHLSPIYIYSSLGPLHFLLLSLKK